MHKVITPNGCTFSARHVCSPVSNELEIVVINANGTKVTTHWAPNMALSVAEAIVAELKHHES